MAAAVLEVAHQALAAGGPVEAVGITNQRASTIVWDRRDRRARRPGARLAGPPHARHLPRAGRPRALRLAPNQSATKVAWLLDTYDPDRAARPLLRHRRHLAGVDAVASGGGALHVTDRSNAGVTGLLRADASGWAHHVLDALNIPETMLPALVDTTGIVGEASALPGQPPIAALVGDQQGSLLGQACVRPGQAKVTFGTGGMLDVCLGGRAAGGRGPRPARHVPDRRLDAGRPAHLGRRGHHAERRHQRGVAGRGPPAPGLARPTAEAVAAACDDTGDVWFVPALLGLGTPHWDYGARSTLLGLDPGHGPPRDRPGRARGHRPPGHRPRRGGRGRHRRRHPDAAGRRGHERQPGSSSRPWPTPASGPSRCRPSPTPRRSAPASWPVWPSGTWSGTDDLAAAWRPGAVVGPGPPLDRARWARGRGAGPGLDSLPVGTRLLELGGSGRRPTQGAPCVDWNRLRRLAAEVDDEHREAMRTIHDDLGAAVFGADDQARASRRRFLQGLGLGGTVLTVGATSIALASAAGAQTTTTGGPTTTGAPTTTTTLPPQATDLRGPRHPRLRPVARAGRVPDLRAGRAQARRRPPASSPAPSPATTASTPRPWPGWPARPPSTPPTSRCSPC